MRRQKKSEEPPSIKQWGPYRIVKYTVYVGDEWPSPHLSDAPLLGWNKGDPIWPWQTRDRDDGGWDIFFLHRDPL